MTRWTRQELEQAFTTYQQVAAEAARTGDWDGWADLFTDDAEYVEHLFGTKEWERRKAELRARRP